jgi:CRISPR-associated protein Cas5d
MAQAYPVALEIAGPAAMFTRPDTGSAPVSYPAPTFSAARGVFDAIARLRTAVIRPTRVEICRPVRYARYFTNYGGPLRKSNQLRLGASYQLPATILVEVCYRLYGEVEERCSSDRATNHLHHLQAMFERRLSRGQSFHVPSLGWKEFVASYVGPFRADTQIDENVSLVIPSMLHELRYQEGHGHRVQAVFHQEVRVEKGVLLYAQ